MHVCTCVRLIILVLVCGIMYHIRAYLVSARTWCQLVISRLPRYVYVYTYVPGWGTYYVPHMYVNEAKRTAMSTITIYTRHNKPYRLGAAPAGVVGTPSRCCPAATVPAAVAFATGLGCCFAEIANKKQNSLLLRCCYR